MIYLKFQKKNFNIVNLARQFLNTPYYWGGRDSHGIDCSGLIQNIMQMKNINFPRDTDMQEDFCTRSILRKNLKAGDLVFWKGHVALMTDKKDYSRKCFSYENTRRTIGDGREKNF